jgi:hypothetical protein
MVSCAHADAGPSVLASNIAEIRLKLEFDLQRASATKEDRCAGVLISSHAVVRTRGQIQAAITVIAHRVRDHTVE